MSPAAISCPKCRVRLNVAAPAEKDQSFSCPKCGHVVLVPGRAAPRSSGHKGMLLALVGSVLLVGAGIIAAVVMTRAPVTPDKVLDIAQVPPAKENLEALAKEKEKLLQDEAAKKDEAEKRSKEYVHWMIEGGTKANDQKWTDALAAYQEALKVMPGDTSASQKLQEVKSALDVLARSKLSDEKLQADLKKLLDQGDEALGKKQYAAALEIYKLVLQKSPGDAGAGKGLVAAQEGLGQDQVERKKQEDFQKHLAIGQAALKIGRYADAVGEFVAAQLILPKNALAAGLQKEAEKALAGDKNRKDQKVDYDRLIDLAATSMRNQRFEDAVDSYKKALQIIPDDAAATKGLDDARKAFQNVAQQLNTLMARGANAMRDARFKDAINVFREATVLSPGNDDAAKALRVAEFAYENRASYIAAMKRGNLALRNRIFDDAAAAFADALRIAPNDPPATIGFESAQRGLNDYLRRRADCDLLVKSGTTAAKQRKYADAAKAFKDALKILPTHPQADSIRSQFRYNDAMADATTALNARRFPDAIRQYQAALLEVPNDYNATAGLTRARALNTKN